MIFPGDSIGKFRLVENITSALLYLVSSPVPLTLMCGGRAAMRPSHCDSYTSSLKAHVCRATTVMSTAFEFGLFQGM